MGWPDCNWLQIGRWVPCLHETNQRDFTCLSRTHGSMRNMGVELQGFGFG